MKPYINRSQQPTCSDVELANLIALAPMSLLVEDHTFKWSNLIEDYSQ